MDNPVTFMLVIVVMFIFYGWIAWIVLNWRKSNRKSQLHQKLLDRFPSAGELQAFLQSENGAQFLDSVKIDGRTPKEKVLSVFAFGAIGILLGFSCLIISLVLKEYAQIFLAVGIFVIALGLGLIFAGLLSLTLGKKWGLFDR